MKPSDHSQEPTGAADALAVADGRLDEERTADVSRALRENEAYRREFAATLVHDSLLREMGSGEERVPEPVPAKFPWVSAAAAAALVIGLGIAHFPPDKHGQSGGIKVELAAGTAPLPGASLPADGAAPGRVALRTGSLHLILPSGPKVQFTAPVDGTFTDPMHLALARGRVTIDVPDGVDGFAVTTSNGHITDLGTRYGVNVRGANDEIVVFDGEIEFRPQASSANTSRFLQGEAAVVFSDGTVTDPASVVTSPDGSDWEIGPSQRPDAVIRHVTDNHRSRYSFKFYPVVLSGVQPGAKAWPYTNNEPSWWPSTSAKDFSPDLDGADLVRVLQEELGNPDLEIYVTLGMPARLFVFFESGAPLPNWLTDEYARTGEQLVLSPSDPATHPDEPFQTTFDAWVREVLEPGTVTLGAVEEADVNSPPFYLYGIAAKALE